MLLQPTGDSSQMIKPNRKKLGTIISGRKFTGTLATDNYQIKNIEVVSEQLAFMLFPQKKILLTTGMEEPASS